MAGQENLAFTIQAVVIQFNNMASCVITTCLGIQRMEAPDRASRMDFWIDVAVGCRAQRNFSSLHAIISALQSAAILRFHSTWRLVSRDSLWKFKKLETITSQENNYSKSRELLLNETAKFTTKEKRLKGSPRWLQKMVPTKGTVPYLGMFLTDLLMTNNAYQDFNEERTMMRKLHKENAILQQLKLLPHSCSYYKIQVEATFLDWFRGLERLSEETSGSSHCASRGQVQPGPDPGSSNLDTAEEPSHTSAHCPGGSRNQSRSSLQGESCSHHEPVTPHPSTPVLLPGQLEVNKQEEPRDVIPKAPEEHWLHRQKPKGLQLVQFASEDLNLGIPETFHVTDPSKSLDQCDLILQEWTSPQRTKNKRRVTFILPPSKRRRVRH
ncbi:ral guanine nucleotide dissociation stimulator-like isoform 2-T2 [Thomomys bottae]